MAQPGHLSERSELLLIRHAPALHEGRMAGRRDVPAILSDRAAFEALRARIGMVDRIITSPALRCRQTAEALWQGSPFTSDERLWEQDFGLWEGLPFADLPDQGDLARVELAALAAPGGESFNDLCARTAPALTEIARLPGRSAIIAHAGTVRAALAMALDAAPAALAFSVDPLSITRLIHFGGAWAIGNVNQAPLP